jgi:hypothetical protein
MISTRVPSRGSLLALAASVAFAGCATPEKKVVDSILPMTDPTAVAPAGTPEPPPAESRIGKIPLLGALPAGGQCHDQKREGLTAIVREVTYTGDYPVRVVKIGVGQPTRAFTPINLDASVRREASPGREEIESITVIFNADGSVQSGRRMYSVSDNSSPSEQRGLSAGDDAAAKQLAEQVLQLCPAT